MHRDWRAFRVPPRRDRGELSAWRHWSIRALFCTVLAFLASSGDWAHSKPVDFDTDVVPILTKSGCNAAACHGSAAGRGGFKLSLFGGDPAWDHHEIAHRIEGRRINLVRPEDSLLLLKPTMELDHEGGYRFEADTTQANTLRSWVQQGAGRLQLRRLADLEI